MSTVDIILTICFLPAIVSGLRKGFIAQAVSLVSLFLGIWLAFHFSDQACSLLSQYIRGVSEAVLGIVAFVLIFSLVALLLFLAGKLLTGVTRMVSLGWLDYVLGFIFAILKAGLFIGVVLIFFDTLNLKFEFVDESKLSESVLYGPLRDLSYKVFPYLKAFLFKE